MYTGVVLKKFPARDVTTKFGSKKVTDFIVQAADGKELKCSVWSELDSRVVGREVSFNGEYNEQYKKVSVKGKVEIIDNTESDYDVPAPSPAKKVVKRPGVVDLTPQITSPLNTVASVPVVNEREDVRKQAEDATVMDIESALRIKDKLRLQDVDLIALADRVGRTISAILADKKRQ